MATMKKSKKKGRLEKAFAAKAKGAGARAAFKAGGPTAKAGAPARAGKFSKPGKPSRSGPARGRVAAADKADRKTPRKSGPRRKTPRSIGREQAPRPVVPAASLPDPSRDLALLAAHAGLEKKADEVTVFDVRGLSSYADYLVIMTAESDRQSGAIADNVDFKLKEAGHAKVSVEGYETGTWIIVDYGDVVTHVFGREARAFYDLEGLWADAPRFTVKD
jgi:ribosome-associated protein